jgi:type I restriction enzyme M protein
LWTEPSPENVSQRQKHFASKQKVLGQFFTPPEVAAFMCSVASDWADRGLAIDPACGDGVFLAALHVFGFQKIVGADIDEEALSKIHRDGNVELHLCDALGGLREWEGQASLVAGNPPFSAKYGRVKDGGRLQHFTFAQGRTSEAAEVLFCEKFIRLAKPAGAIAIILPQGFFASLPLRHIRSHLLSCLRIKAIISLSRKIFKAKSSILLAVKESMGEQDYPVFLAVAEELDNLPLIEEAYRAGESLEHPQAFWKPISALCERMDVEYHLPFYDETLRTLQSAGVPLERLGKLLVFAKTGGTNYGAKRQFSPSGLRFISARTVTATGLDFTREEKFIAPGSSMDKRWARVQPEDILFVRVGAGCAGRVTVVMDENDLGVANDYLYILRLKPQVDPCYFALYANTAAFKAQIDRLKRGVGTVTIPHQALKDVLVPLLPLDVQRQYAQVYRMVVKRHRVSVQAKRESKTIEALRYQSEAGRLLQEAVASLEALLGLTSNGRGGETSGDSERDQRRRGREVSTQPA